MARLVMLTVPILTLASLAHAEPSAPARNSDSDSTDTYRTSIAVTSGLGLAMLLAVPATEDPAPSLSDGLFLTGMATSTLVPLIAHGLHGQAERGFASLGVRVAGLAAGALAGKQIGECDNVVLCDESYIGMVAGLTVASVIDVVVFARTKPSEKREHSVVPMVSATSSGGHVGLAGAF